MGWKQIVHWFSDLRARNRFLGAFNDNAKYNFQNLTVDALLQAKTCQGNPEGRYRHEMSAPVFVSGFAVEVTAGVEIPVDDIIQIGQIILYDERIVRWLWALHWDTLIVRDTRTGRNVQWAIKDFVHLGGLLNTIQQNLDSMNNLLIH